MKFPETCHPIPPLILYSYVPYPPAGDVIVIMPSDAP